MAPYFTKQELAAHLNVHSGTIDRLVRTGKFPQPLKLTENGVCRWPQHVIEAWEAQQLANPPVPDEATIARRKEIGRRGGKKTQAQARS